VVAAYADVYARMKTGTALTHDDIARYDFLATEYLDAKTLGF
jgi:hypothetical protein